MNGTETVAEVTCPHCGTVVKGNIPAKPENNPVYEYSRCTNCHSKFRIKRFTGGGWMVDSW